MTAHFTDDEINLICIYDTQSKNALIHDMEKAMPYIKDRELKHIVQGILAKIQTLTDIEFLAMEFTPTIDIEDTTES